VNRRQMLRRTGVAAAGLAGLALAGCRKKDQPGTPVALPQAKQYQRYRPFPPRPRSTFPSIRDTWEALDVTRAGWNEHALVDAATYAGAHNTAGLLITQGGRIVLEQYWEGFGRHSSADVAPPRRV